jgi:hypothetical protein
VLALFFDDVRALLRLAALAAPIYCPKCARQIPGNVQALHRFCGETIYEHKPRPRRRSGRRNRKEVTYHV